MDAPRYLPSEAYEAPRIVKDPLNARTTPFSDLQAIPAAMAIVYEAPSLRMALRSPQIQPYLGNMSPASLLAFEVLTEADLERIDIRLAKLAKEIGR